MMPVVFSNIRLFRAVIACGAALIIAGGCHSDAPITGRGEEYDTPWLMTTAPLRADTRIGQARQTYDEFNLLHVVVPVRNTTDHNIPLAYKFFFYDPTGTEASSISGQTTVPPRGQVELTGNATKAQPAGPMPFRLELRYLEPYAPGARVGT